MRYISKYSEFEKTNEGLKTWLSTFLLMANLGLVPLSLKSAPAEKKKEFVESQPGDKVDAAKFIKFLNMNGLGRPIDQVWTDFIKTDSTVTSSIDDVKKYINQDGKTYHIDQKYQVQDFTNVDMHKFSVNNYLTDMGSFIPDSLEPRINNFIYEYEQKTSVEIAIITVKSLDDQPVEDYAQEQFDRIGIGKRGADNGILIVFSMDDRRSRIHTGYGIEPFLTDAQCYRLLNNVVKPNFKEQKYFDGTMALLNSIKEELGEEAISNKQEWLKRKQEEDARISEAQWEDTKEFLFKLFLLSLVLGPIGYGIYRLIRNKIDSKSIEETIKYIEKAKSELPTSTGIDSGRLRSKLDNLIRTIRSIDVKDTKGAKSISDKRDVIEEYKSIVDSSISEYNSAKSKVETSISSIRRIDSDISNSYDLIEKAILAFAAIKGFGYTITEPSKSSDFENVANIGTQAKQLLSNSKIDDAMDKYEEYLSKRSRVLSTSQSAISKLSDIKEAKSKVERSKSHIDSALSDMNSYSRWGRSSEKSEIENEVSSYYLKMKGSTDYLMLVKLLNSLLSKIEDMKSKWRRRKREEEEEEDRRRRAAMSSSSSSGSYGGGGGSSFGGFGGGSSGGGGASGGW